MKIFSSLVTSNALAYLLVIIIHYRKPSKSTIMEWFNHVINSSSNVCCPCKHRMKRWYFPHWQYMVIIGHELRSNWVHSALRCQAVIGPDSWWRHQMETFSALLAICVGNSPVPGEFPSQRPVTMSFDVFFDLRLNKRLSKQSWRWWFKTLSRPLWRHCNVKPF